MSTVRTLTDFALLYLREKYNLPEEWRWYKWERLGDTPRGDATLYCGAVAPLFKSGPRIGLHNWRKRDRSTEFTAAVTDDEIRRFEIDWEARTGKCHQCEGTGQQWAGWSREKGSEFKDCSRCGATGKRPEAAA